MSLVMQGENVYTINALMHALYDNDYHRVCEDLTQANTRITQLEDAIRDYGLGECYENGVIVLRPIPPENDSENGSCRSVGVGGTIGADHNPNRNTR